MLEISLEYRSPTVPEYQKLRDTTGWNNVSDAQVVTALDHDLFNVCATSGEETIGVARIIGDGSIYFYIQDVIVHPNFQGQGVGKKMMEKVMDWLEKNAPSGAFIGLMAAKDVADFYATYGFEVRPSDRPGMYKLIK